jgi:hypothetical protein
MDAAPVDAHMNMSNDDDDAATIIQTRFRGISVRTMKPRARLQAEFDAVMGDGEASVSASDAATNVVDDDDQESVNFDAGSNTAEADTAMEATEAEQNDDFEEEEVEEVVQPAVKKKRMVLEVLSTLDGPYWNKETSRRKIVRE